MPTDDEMTIHEERKYLRKMQKRYVKSDREEQGRLLDEMVAFTGKHRKSLIRLMNGDLARKKRRKQRGKTYGPDVDDALRVIDESLDQICAERLTPNLVWLATHLAAHGEMEAPASLLDQLAKISTSTVRRRLNTVRQDQPRLPQRRGRAQPNPFTKDIPMVRIPWDEQAPGHFEVDLVHHCGPSASGEYVCTLQMIDVATGWSERAAVLGRSYRVMEDAFRCILARLPFPVLEIHPDNGSEFFNHHMRRFWGDIAHSIHLSRSRPYHKNDNRFVEQKNSTLIRAYLGNDRLDTVAQTLATNHLYDRMWFYYNFFQPVMRMKEKTVTPACDGQPARAKRFYDVARTPFDRLCDTGVLLEEHRQQLEARREETNPRQLRQEIYDWIDHIFSLPGAVRGVSENVHHTLRAPVRLETNNESLFAFRFDRTAIMR